MCKYLCDVLTWGPSSTCVGVAGSHGFMFSVLRNPLLIFRGSGLVYISPAVVRVPFRPHSHKANIRVLLVFRMTAVWTGVG